ncbi:MAG: hypothetical protein ACHQ1D_03835 [Nitrososphaerales archaeon]
MNLANKVSMTKNSYIPNWQNPAYGILDVLNKRDLPEVVKGYVKNLKGKDSFFDDLYHLKWKLENELKRISPKLKKEIYFIKLFLGLVYYYLEDEDVDNITKALEFLNDTISQTVKIIKEPRKRTVLLSILISVKHRLTRLDKLVFLIDAELSSSKYLTSVQRHYSKYLRMKRIVQFDESKFQDALRRNDQMFIFAHGDESGTYLGGKKITESWLIKCLKKPEMQLSVLGVFSCQENLSKSRVKDFVDYFITDTISSSLDYNEMFAYGYVHNYLKSWRVFDSFEIGKLGPVFRANSDVRLELYQGGTPISR